MCIRDRRNKYHNIPLWVIMNTLTFGPVSYTHLDDGKAPNKHKKIMVNFMEDNADSEIYSNELKDVYKRQEVYCQLWRGEYGASLCC